MRLSVIVPICNVEKYLAECLESVLLQKKYSMEVICVNDGSKDKSLFILQQYKTKDNRIIIIDKPNTGYGDSMNVGLKRASGDYVGIVESDDIVINGAFEKLLIAAEMSKADVIKGNFNYYFSNKNNVSLYPNFKDFPTEKKISVSDCPELFFTVPAIWSGIYKRSFLEKNNISFLPTPGASYQDTSFAFKVWAVAKTVYLLTDPIINYRQDNSEASSNISKKVFNIFNETKEMERFLIKHHLEHFYPEFIKAKYISYGWTINRLNANDKKKFFLKWIPEVKTEFDRGYFIKKYWDIYSWVSIYHMVFNSEKYIESICAGKDIPISPPLNNDYYLSHIHPIYIYGAGKYGIRKKQELNSKGITVSAFVVSEKGSNPDSVDGIPVIPIGQIDRDGLIFIGVSDKFKLEILGTLEKNWLMNNLMSI